MTRSLPVRGAWIEMETDKKVSELIQSLPVRGAWIEIERSWAATKMSNSRSP